MKRLLLPLLAVMLLASCQKDVVLSVEISNPLAMVRSNETVEVPWEAVVQKFGEGVEPNGVCVMDAEGKVILSQVVYEGQELPQLIIFQASLDKQGKATYSIKKGKPLTQPSKVYGRLVPERKDDYAWENNKIAFRMYGPALQATGEISNGIDVWAKSTEEMVIDKWYKDDLAGVRSYHEDHGEGLDFYKVGRTLGGGAMAPYINNKLVLGNNFVTSKTLDNGPLRITFELMYAPLKIKDKTVVEVRRVSLDANSNFNRVMEVYAGADDMQVAVGIVKSSRRTDDYEVDESNGWVAFKDLPDGNKSGAIYVAAILPGRKIQAKVAEKHLLAVANYKAAEPFFYYNGAGWSKAGFATDQDWYSFVALESEKLNRPLTIVLK